MNTFIIFFLNKHSKMLRRIFLNALNLELFKEQLTIRATTNCLLREVQEKTPKLTGQPVPKETPAQGKRGRCQECVRKDRKMQYYCSKCFKFLCLEHSIYVVMSA
jgi:hypothetical protein